MSARVLRSFSFLVPTFAVLLATASGCAATEEDEIEDGTQDLVGGSAKVESSVVYLFDGAGKNTLPKCSGALLGPKVAVTAKACARDGMTVGRAQDKSGNGVRARIVDIQVPDGLDADIAVIELDRTIGGTKAVITHSPLKDGYTVNSLASDPSLTGRETDTQFGRAQTASVRARMVSETEMHGEILPATGSQICNTDLGAPVCSSVRVKNLLGMDLTGTCGLAGLVIGPSDAPAPATPVGTPTGTTPAAPTLETRACSSNAWKVVQLGRHAEFLRRFAPDAFRPIQVDGSFFESGSAVPEDLWGFRSNGTVRTCKIETPTLTPVALGAEARLTARVSFSGLQERAATWGRFGIALKAAPTKVRWLPATMDSERRGNSFETTFSGAVSANVDGDYIVMFRASANGGETWTQCDTDGIENSFSLEKAVGLKVGNGTGTPTTTPTDAPTSPTDPSTASDSPSASETSPSGDDGATEGGEEDKDKAAAKKKKKAAGGCAVALTGTSSNNVSYAPMLGLALGLGALARRRARR